jgi:low temperature requirement protein LtrA
MRDRTAGQQRVTNVELFFDLVFVFAVTQLSHYLLSGQSPGGHAETAFRAALLLTMVWLVWAYTTWVTNWLDPERIAVRLLLLVLALVSLLFSAALPTAFGRYGLIVGAAYLAMQVGRSAFAAVAIDDPALRRNYQRILAWCVVSGLLALAGGLAHGDARALLWIGAVVVDLSGGAVGFYTPGLGRSRTADWTIEGGHFAERCQGFVLIAIGESIVVIGARLAATLEHPHPHSLTAAMLAFLIAVVGSVAFWWVYFDRAARDAAEIIASSADPGRLGRSAYHLIHPIMVAGIIVTAAGDGAVGNLAAGHGTGRASWWVASLILGGPALFLAGHAAFKAVIWRRISWQRIGAIVALGLCGFLTPHIPALALAACGAAAVLAVAIADHIWRPPSARRPARRLGRIGWRGRLGLLLRFRLRELSRAPAHSGDDRAHREARRVPRHPPRDSGRPRSDDERLVPFDATEHVLRQRIGLVQRAELPGQGGRVGACLRLGQVRIDPAEQRRVDEPRAHRAHLDTPARALGAQRQAEPDDRVLDRVIGRKARPGNQPGQRRGIDDVAVPLVQHQRVRGMRPVDDTFEIDVDHPVPVIERQFLNQAADGDAGVVEDEVEPAVLGCDLVHECGYRVRVADIEDRRAHLPAFCGDRARDHFRSRLVDVSDHDRRAARGERTDEGRADPRPAAGDDRDAARECIRAWRACRRCQFAHLAIMVPGC